jgi:hypothetical protein
VDFSKAMRGVYAHRMGENCEDEKRVADYWKGLGFAVESLESDNDRFSRQPDLRLLRNGKPVAYCEVKTIQRHRHHIRILHEDREIEERVELSAVPVEERLSTDLVTAIRQLNYANSDRTLLNFVVLVNRDPESSPALLAKLFAQRPPKSKRGLKAKHESWTVEAIQNFRREVDLCLWVDGLSNFSVTGYFVGNPSIREQVEGFTGLGLEKLLPLEPAA